MSGVERRRQWSDAEKARIIEETLVLGARVSKPLFADLLDAFAKAVGAGPKKRVLLLLDNAG